MAQTAILGGGVAGVVVAKRLADRGLTGIELIEKNEILGGLHRSFHLEGLVFDIGAFLFSSQHELLQAFPSLKEKFVPLRARYLSITPKGSVCRYPMTLRAFRKDNGRLRLFLAALDLCLARIKYRRRDTVASFAKYYIGTQIYDRSGLRNYIERLYGAKDEEIDLQFALERLADIKNYVPSKILIAKISQFLAPFLAKRVDDTLLARPINGFDSFYEDVATLLRERGVIVRLGCKLQSISPLPDGRFALEFDGNKREYDRVISTVPISTALRLVGLEPRIQFEHMSLLSLFYRGNVCLDGSILYNFTREGKWKRIVVLSSFYGRDRQQDYFTVEITLNDLSSENQQALRNDFETHALNLGLLANSRSFRFVSSTVTPHAYPIFRRGASGDIRSERERLARLGIDLIGRQGNFSYLSSHLVAKQATTFATKLDLHAASRPRG